MSPEKAVVLLSTVIKRTDQNKVAWSATATDDAFEVSFPSSTLRVLRHYELDHEIGEYISYYDLEILNTEGRTVDKIEPHELQSFIDKPWRATEQLFKKARDYALGVDQAIDEILKELGGAIRPDDGEELPDEIPF